MITKVTGIIVKEYTVGESDKYITLFTKEMGKIQVGAPRAKKFDRGLASGTQLFVYGEFVISGYRDQYKLLSVEVLHMFHKLSEDLFKLSYATYIAEFVTEVSTESSGNEKLLSLMLHALHSLVKEQADVKLIACVFDIKAMVLLGFMLEIQHCLFCNAPVDFNKQSTYVLSIEEGGIVCDTCSKSVKGIKIGYTAWYTLYYIMYSPINKSFQFTLTQDVLQEIMQVAQAYVPYYIEKQFKSLAFIKSLERF